MNDLTTSAGATAPRVGERALAPDPQHAPAVATLTLEQATRLRGRIEALAAAAHELGGGTTVYVHGFDSISAFDVLPEGREQDVSGPDHVLLSRWAQVHGSHVAILFTPSPAQDAA